MRTHIRTANWRRKPLLNRYHTTPPSVKIVQLNHLLPVSCCQHHVNNYIYNRWPSETSITLLEQPSAIWNKRQLSGTTVNRSNHSLKHPSTIAIFLKHPSTTAIFLKHPSAIWNNRQLSVSLFKESVNSLPLISQIVFLNQHQNILQWTYFCHKITANHLHVLITETLF